MCVSQFPSYDILFKGKLTFVMHFCEGTGGDVFYVFFPSDVATIIDIDFLKDPHKFILDFISIVLILR
jgi:hypothetical protein